MDKPKSYRKTRFLGNSESNISIFLYSYRLAVGNAAVWQHLPYLSRHKQGALWLVSLGLEAVDSQEPYEALETCLRQDDHS